MTVLGSRREKARGLACAGVATDNHLFGTGEE
jgi:hypothetical protein